MRFVSKTNPSYLIEVLHIFAENRLARVYKGTKLDNLSSPLISRDVVNEFHKIAEMQT